MNENILQIESTVVNGRRKIEAIIGKENDIGVENLVGSGLIASETSAAYREVPTYCLVSLSNSFSIIEKLILRFPGVPLALVHMWPGFLIEFAKSKVPTSF